MAKNATEKQDKALALLKEVEKLAAEGKSQKEIAKLVGYKTTFTLNNHLVKASQLSGKPVPPFKPEKGARGGRKVELVEVKQRGKGDAIGVNIPQQPLDRLNIKKGDKLKVSVRGKNIVITKA